MEVTTRFPPSPSPTTGDDLCEIDVSDVAIHSVTLLICLCGLARNGAVLWLLNLRIHKYCILELAVIDFLFLLFTFPSTLLFLVEDVSCSHILPLMYLSFLFQLSEISSHWGIFRLMALSAGKDMFFLCELCCSYNLPLRLKFMVWSTQFWAFFALFTVIPTVTLLCPSQEQEHCRAALISMYTITLLLFATPMVISETIDIIKDKCGSQQQQPKKRDIVIFLILLFTLLLSLYNPLQQLNYILMSSCVFFLLTCIHSSIKPFIYFLAGRCWRHCSMQSLKACLHRVFEEQK